MLLKKMSTEVDARSSGDESWPGEKTEVEGGSPVKVQINEE